MYKKNKDLIKADFHIHSYFSADSNMSPETIVKFAKKRGLQAIAVTDHNTIKGGIETKKVAKDLIVFVGSEIKTEKGEIIGLNLKKDIPPFLSLEETCKLIKKQGGLVFVPHPFDKFRFGVGNEIKKIIKYIYAIEVFNSRTLINKFNEDAMNFAKKYKIPIFAGSDAHFESEIGSCYMLIEAKNNEKGILNAIKNMNLKISGNSTGLKPHWKTFVKKLKTKFNSCL